MLEIRTILVPVDFTETSDRALTYAVSLAERFGASVVILHAYQIPVYGFPDGAYITAAEVAVQLSAAAQTRLDALYELHQGSGVAITTLLRDGTPWEEIHDVAIELKADLIVVGTHGRRGISRALLGSIAESVIRTTTVPTLVVHGSHEGESK